MLTAVISSIFYPLIVSGSPGGGSSYVAGLMWSPAFAAFFTIIILKLDWRSLGLGWGGRRAAGLSIAIPLVYISLAYLMVWILGLGSFPDTEAISSTAEKIGWTITNPLLFLPLYFVFLLATGLAAGVSRALGEEIGWRGFLTPHIVEKWGFVGGTLATGVIWTAWHVPLLVFGDYNSDAPIWFALACFGVMVLAISVMLTWLRLTSNSVWPCAFLHASHNLFIQRFFTPMTKANGAVTDYAIDEFGFAVPLVALLMAAMIWNYHVKGTTKKPV
jgi:membrane protease YdiL (CAAX protease family)